MANRQAADALNVTLSTLISVYIHTEHSKTDILSGWSVLFGFPSNAC